MKPDSWQAQIRIETDYDRAIRRLMQRSWQIIGQDPDLMNPWDLLRRLERFAETGSFHQFALAIAQKMVTHTLYDTAKTWRQAAREGSKGRMIYQALQNELQGPVGGTVYRLIERNAELIRSLPASSAGQAAFYIQKEALKGKRHEQITRELLEKFPQMTDAKAALIARTEASKAHTVLIQARADRLGLAWYIWRTSRDSRVRTSHDYMDGVLVRFDTPPAPELLAGIKSTLGNYNAGEAPNCRCYPEVLIDLTDVSWPRKVHYGGRIITMSMEQFRRVA